MSVAELFHVPTKFELKDADATRKLIGSTTGQKSEDKQADKLQTASLAEQISALQEVFAANHDHKLLVILQGMDTSGKDGTVKSVFGQLHPLGARTVRLKRRAKLKKTVTFYGVFTKKSLVRAKW